MMNLISTLNGNLITIITISITTYDNNNDDYAKDNNSDDDYVNNDTDNALISLNTILKTNKDVCKFQYRYHFFLYQSIVK